MRDDTNTSRWQPVVAYIVFIGGLIFFVWALVNLIGFFRSNNALKQFRKTHQALFGKAQHICRPGDREVLTLSSGDIKSLKGYYEFDVSSLKVVTLDSSLPRPSASFGMISRKPWPETISYKPGTLQLNEPFSGGVEVLCPKDYEGKVVTLLMSALARYPIASHGGYVINQNTCESTATVYVIKGNHETAVLEEYGLVKERWNSKVGYILGVVVFCGIIVNGMLMSVAYAYLANQRKLRKKDHHLK